MDPYRQRSGDWFPDWDQGNQDNRHRNMQHNDIWDNNSYQEMAPPFRGYENGPYNQFRDNMSHYHTRESFHDSDFAAYMPGPRGRWNNSRHMGRGGERMKQWRGRGRGGQSFGNRAHDEDHLDSRERHDQHEEDHLDSRERHDQLDSRERHDQHDEDHLDSRERRDQLDSRERRDQIDSRERHYQHEEDHLDSRERRDQLDSRERHDQHDEDHLDSRERRDRHQQQEDSNAAEGLDDHVAEVATEAATEATQEIHPDQHGNVNEGGDEDNDDELPPSHTRGLMSTLIGLIGPGARNKKPDPLPEPQPMKFEDDTEKYLGTAKHTFLSETIFLENGITPNMIAEANMEIDDRDLRPEDIGREIDKAEFYCKLCQKQTTSLGNFRDHLNGRSHKSMLEAVKSGRTIIKGKKKPVRSLTEPGNKSVCMDIVETCTESLIGLSYITEFHNQTGVMCVCNLCAVKFDCNIIISHVTGCKHRLRYMKEQKPAMYMHLKKFGGKKSQLTQFLQELSMDVEKEDGRGVTVVKMYEPEIKEEKKDPVLNTEDLEQRLRAFANQGEKETIAFQDWVDKEVAKSKEKYEEKKQYPSSSKYVDLDRHMDLDRSERRGSRPRRDLDSYLPHHSARPHLYPHIPKREMLSPTGPQILDAYFDDSYRNSQHLIPERRDVLKRIHRSEQYMHNHHMAEFRNMVELHPEPRKRLQSRDPPLDPNPVRRLEKLAARVDSSSLKKATHLRRETKESNTVFIDYGHGSKDKDEHVRRVTLSARSTADKWENDIRQILEHSKKQSPLDSLALLSNAYSSDEGSPSPPLESKPKKKLPFSRTYLEMAESRQVSKFREETKKPQPVDSRRNRESFRDPQSSDSRSGSKIELPEYPKKLLEQSSGQKYSHNSSSSRRSRSKSPVVSRSHYGNPEHYTFIESKQVTSYGLKRKYSLINTNHSQSVLLDQRRSRSPKQSRSSRRSMSPVRSRSPVQSRIPVHSRSPVQSRRSTSPVRSRSPVQSRSHRRSGSPRYSSAKTEVSKYRSRSPRQSRSPRNSQSPVRSANKSPTINKMKEEVEDTPTKMDSDVEADIIAAMLLQISSTMTGTEEPHAALQILLSNPALTKALLASKANAAQGKTSSEKSQSDKSHGTKHTESPERSRHTRYSRSPEKSTHAKYSRSPERSSRHAGSSGEPAKYTRHSDESPKFAPYVRPTSTSDNMRQSAYHDKTDSSQHSRVRQGGSSKPAPPPREKVAFAFSGSQRSAHKITLPLEFESESDD